MNQSGRVTMMAFFDAHMLHKNSENKKMFCAKMQYNVSLHKCIILTTHINLIDYQFDSLIGISVCVVFFVWIWPLVGLVLLCEHLLLCHTIFKTSVRDRRSINLSSLSNIRPNHKDARRCQLDAHFSLLPWRIQPQETSAASSSSSKVVNSPAWKYPTVVITLCCASSPEGGRGMQQTVTN